MKSKRSLAIIIALIMIVTFALSACGSSTPSTPPTDSGSSGATDNTATDNTGSTGDTGAATAAQIAQAAVDYTAQVQSEITPGATSSKDTLTFAAVADPGKISLDNMLDFTLMPFVGSVVEYFIRYDFEKGEYYSPVCDSFALDADGQGVTFNITPGIKMNDGNIFGPSDILESIQAYRDNSGLGWQLDFVDIPGSKIIDDTTLDLRFTAPNGVWESGFLMLTLISGKAFLAAKDADTFYQAPIGPQAYDITEWVPGDHITATAFDGYYKGTPPIKTLVCKIISDSTARFMALQNGDIDLLWNISADQVQTAYASDNLKILMTGQNMMVYLGMNSGNKALSDFRVRQAIMLAVNRQDIIDGAYNGLAYPSNGILTPECIGYDPNSKLPDQDVATAKDLMSQAGYGDGLTLRILAESTINFQLVTEQLTSQLAEIGITLQPTLTDAATQNAMIFSGDTTGYDLFLSVAQDANDSISFIDNPMLFGASHPELSADGSGAGFEAIWNQIRQTPDVSQRAPLYKQANDYFIQNGLYWIPMCVAQTYVGVNKDLTGIFRNGINGFFAQAYFR